MAFWTSGRSKNGIYEYKGKNGLTLLLVPRKGIDVTTANITYHVGSRNEGLGLKGATHYLEHGMFKGSKNYHGKNGMWKLEELGAYMNATTYTDRTNYFEVIDTKFLEEAVAREGDRMQNALLTEELLKSESTVVRNEFERGENNDFEIAHKRMVATAFMAHPYHHSTIGWKSDIENVSAEALQNFHRTYYVPNNATYTFVGNFDPQEIKTMVQHHFEDIPHGGEIPSMYTKEPAQMGQRRVQILKPTQTALLGLGFKSVKGMHKDSIVNQLLASILTAGPSSRFSELKKSNKSYVHDVMASAERMKDPYLFSLWISTNNASEQAVNSAESQVMQTLKNFHKPTEAELNTAKNKIKFAWKDAMETTRGMASEINEAIARGDAFDVYQRFDVLESVTPDDILRVARETFNERESIVVQVLPGPAAPVASSDEAYEMTDISKAEDIPPTESANTNLEFANSSTVDNTHTKTKMDANKLHLRLSLQTESSFSPKEYASRLVLSELIQKGIETSAGQYSEGKIQQYYDNNGVTRGFGVGDHGVRIYGTIPNGNNMNKSLALLQKEITSPILSSSDFEYIKNRMCAELRGGGNDVNSVAKTLINQNLFKPNTVHYRHSPQEVLKALNSLRHSDITREYERLKNGKSVLTVLGKTPNVVNFEFEKGLIGYDNTNDAVSRPGIIKHNIPGKTSTTVVMAQHTASDMATKIAVGILGNGFSGRLMKIVRDKYGLTYGIEAYLKDKQGTMHITSTFAPTNLERGIKETNKVVKDWSTANITEEEVNIQKTILKGIRKVRFDDKKNIINNIHMEKLYGNDLNYIDKYDERVDAVGIEDVKQAIKNIDIERFTTVIVGTL